MEDKLHNRIGSLCVSPETPLIAALQQMDQHGVKILLVMHDRRFLSVVSVGDIQRAIIRQMPLDTPVRAALREHVRVAHADEPTGMIHRRMLEHRIELMPVIDDNNNLVDVILWQDVFPSTIRRQSEPIDVPVVVMAGGRGARLRPLTNIIPKPLLPLGDRPVIEEIMDRFNSCGARNFYISLNYKAAMIEDYLKSLPKPYNLHFLREDQPLGTAGSLQLLRAVLPKTFFVSNCDIVVDHDYGEILRQHRDERNEITAVAAVNVQSVPYGVFECDDSGRLLRLREKPDLSLLVNVGLYVLESHLLAEIAPGQPVAITDLMEKVRVRGGRVGIFPISERSWADIGEWQKYFQAVAQASLHRSQETQAAREQH